ncbi:MAG TPA: M14 family zinc carboxypeptidase [Kofleriaceae bacterium]|nr:M14 family zinc carboxypeptidase [Kofleriaceae bacterium]
MLRETVRVPLGTSLLALAAAVASTPHATPTTRVQRVAIRVDCAAPAACPLAESLALDVWSEDRGPGLPLDVVVPATALRALSDFEILDPDIDATARAESERLHAASAARPGEDWFAEYRDYDAIAEHLRELAAAAPDRVAMQAIGGSIEGRPIWAVRIGRRGPGVTPILIDGTQHAREWIAAMTTTCVADRLVRDYDRDPAIRAFVDRTELWVVPVVNPDGYDYTWGTDRFWRKNRRGGYGVDLNRNFAIAWGGDGSSSSKRSEIYRGEYAFSEPESAALRDLAKREGIAVHVDFHAYGQLLLYPWGYTASPAKDRDRFAAVGDRMASAMYAAHGTRYSLMQSVELYPASGTMEDWMYGEAGAQSFTIELRPKGRGGFVLPPDQIRPTCDEALAALLALRDAH